MYERIVRGTHLRKVSRGLQSREFLGREYPERPSIALRLHDHPITYSGPVLRIDVEDAISKDKVTLRLHRQILYHIKVQSQRHRHSSFHGTKLKKERVVELGELEVEEEKEEEDMKAGRGKRQVKWEKKDLRQRQTPAPSSPDTPPGWVG